MKTAIAIGIVFMFDMQAPAMEIETIIDRLEMIESGGDVEAIGDSGDAVGILQIHKVMCEEANRLSTYQFSYDDRFNRKKSRLIAKIFLVAQIRKYYKKFKKLPSDTVLACSWNSGNVFKPVNKNYEKKYRRLR